MSEFEPHVSDGQLAGDWLESEPDWRNDDGRVIHFEHLLRIRQSVP